MSYGPEDELRIDPETSKIVGLGADESYTAEEFASLLKPRCPACGTRVDVRPARVTSLADTAEKYILGTWSCPNRCQQRP